MRINVQGRLMQARFIEIHQVFAKKKNKFGYFSNNENPTRALNPNSLKCCLPSTDAIDMPGKNSRMHMKVQGRLMQARFIEIHQVFANIK
jgi:hypothetical protein